MALLQHVPIADLMPGADLDALIGHGHGGGYGMTGTGKTEALRYLEKHHQRLTVVWNPEEEPFAGVPVQTVQEVAQAFKQGARKVSFIPPMDQAAAKARFAELEAFLFAWGKRLKQKAGGKKAEHFLTLFVDEAQTIAPKEDTSGPLHRLFQRGRKYGLRVWVFSQEPNQVAHVALTQPQVFLLWEVNHFRVPYMEGYGIPMSTVWGHIKKPHHFAVVVGNRYALSTPLPLV